MTAKKPDFKETTREMCDVAGKMFTDHKDTEKLAVKKIRKKGMGKIAVNSVKAAPDNGTEKISVEKIREKDTVKTSVSYGQSHIGGQWERRTERLELKLTPSMLEFIKSRAAKDRTTINETVNRMLYYHQQAST